MIMKTKMRKLIILAAALSIFAGAAFAAEPTLLKRTVHITVKRYLRYWKNPAAAEPVYNMYSWVPQINFDVLGAVANGDQFSAEFDTPDGKPWINFKMHTNALGPDELSNIRIEDTMSDGDLEKKAILFEGLVPFRIKFKRASGGAETVLFSGNFKVGTYLLDQKIPEYKGKKDFFVDYDWHLPLAYLWLNPSIDPNVPRLSTSFCLRSIDSQTKMVTLLYYNGKEISKYESSGNNIRSEMSSPAGEPSHSWSIAEFTFNNVMGFNHSQSANDYSSQFFLDKNPGEYEIKLLREGQLARSFKFIVGIDGKIVDNKIAANAKLNGVRMIFAAKVSGTGEGAWNANAWSTEALFGNPPAGFTVTP